MALEPFVAKEVRPGEPVTAQGWNDIVRALAGIVAFLQSTTGARMRVILGNTDVDRARVRVTAIGADGSVTDAAAPVPPDDAFTLQNLIPGAYTVRAEAPGFTPATAAITVPATAPVTLTMQRAAPAMPALFGRELAQALSTLQTANIVVNRVLDVTGREIAPANPAPEFRGSPVLLQLPAVGEPVPAGTGAQLVVAAALEIEPTIEMPSLAGLSLAEVRKVLDELGLVLGRVQTKS
jgi:hypothetical protein